MRRSGGGARSAVSPWSGLYFAGAAAAVIAVLFFRRNCAAELALLRSMGVVQAGPPDGPVSAREWFALLQSDPLVGLVLLNLIDVVNYVLVGLIFLALYAALKERAPGAMLVATVGAVAGGAVYIASNQAFALLALSERYAAAAPGEQAALLSAGEALLAADSPVSVFKGTGYHAGLFLVVAAGMIVSTVMWRTTVFSRWTAVAGLVANGLALAYFLAVPLTPAWTWLFPTLSAPFRMAWYLLIAVRLFRLAHEARAPELLGAASAPAK